MYLETLTATEARVAGLIASGHDDDEISAALALGDRGCERHLAEVYRKLGIHSRTELALMLGHGRAHEKQQETVNEDVRRTSQTTPEAVGGGRPART